MKTEQKNSRRGFTAPEKWIIWGVFCLLVGLSTSRLTVFLGMLITSIGISLVIKKQKLILAVSLSIIGILNIVFSKYLI